MLAGGSELVHSTSCCDAAQEPTHCGLNCAIAERATNDANAPTRTASAANGVGRRDVVAFMARTYSARNANARKRKLSACRSRRLSILAIVSSRCGRREAFRAALRA